MQHQVLAQQQFHVYQRWMLSDVLFPTSFGLEVQQAERRERNRIAIHMEKEQHMLARDERDRMVPRHIYLRQVEPCVEFEALENVEEVQRRRIARQYKESFQRLTFEMWEEPLARGVIAIGRERWYRDLVRPTQVRLSIVIKEQLERREMETVHQKQLSVVLRDAVVNLYEMHYKELLAQELREYRRLQLDHLKERRQRDARAKDAREKKENLQRYLQNSIVASGSRPVLGDALMQYGAAAAAEILERNYRSPTPNYTTQEFRRSRSVDE
jgi:hypothetical protein